MPIRTLDVINICAIIISPIVAVAVTLWYQSRKEKRDAKISLFFKLFSHRKVFPPSPDLVQALNSIDLIFHNSAPVVKLWHEYFSMLQNPSPSPAEMDKQNKKYLDLLFEIAENLDYKSLRQTSIDNFYQTAFDLNKINDEVRIRQQLLRVLEKTDSFLVSPKKQ